MVWKETCLMDERTEFIVAWKRGFLPMTALCEAHGISRKTGYKWRDRYLAFGWDGLVDVSRDRLRPGRPNDDGANRDQTQRWPILKDRVRAPESCSR